MIQDRLMAAGSWELQLREDVNLQRFSLDLASYAYSMLVVTPTWMDPRTTLPSQLRSQAIFCGLYRNRPKERTLGGPGLAVLLGDEDGRGDLLGASPTTRSAAGADAWVGPWLGSNGVTADGVFSGGASTYTGTIPPNGQYWTVRKALQFICDACGVEWQIRYAGPTLAMAAYATLFGTTMAATIVPTEDRTGGREPARRAFPVGDYDVMQDVDDWTSATIYRTTQASTAVATVTGTQPYYAPDGNLLIMERYVETNAVDPSAVTAFATSEQARATGRNTAITLYSDEYTIPADLRPGYQVGVYAPDYGIYNTGGSVPYQGHEVFPVAMRVMGTNSPFREGLGVYLVRGQAGDTADAITDLSRSYVIEKGRHSVIIGALPRPLAGSFAGAAVSSSTPAGNVILPPAAQGTTPLAGPWIAYTPAFVQTGSVTVSGTTQTSAYQLSDYTCRGEVHYLSMSASGGSAGASITMTLPVTAKYASQKPVGWWRHYDSSAGISRGGFLALSGDGTKVIFPGWTHGALGNDPNLTLGAGDELYVFFDYETV